MDFLPGKAQRCATEAHPRKRNALVRLYEDGKAGYAVNFENSATAIQWKDGDAKEITEEQRAKQRADARARMAAKRSEEQQGTMRAQTLYAVSTALVGAPWGPNKIMLPNHAYIRGKMLDMMGCRGLKIDSEGWLVVPMHRDGKLISCQRISPDGQKRFIKGAPVKGATFRIWRPGAVVTILAEGLATGLAVFSAMTNAEVIVCFSASNLIEVAKRGTWSGMMAIAGDNDWMTICKPHKDAGQIEPIDPETPGRPDWCMCNPGKTDAMRAAKAIGCGWTVPICEGTDWSDFMQERLRILEKQDEQAIHRRTPAKLRQSALMPIRAEMMKAIRNVSPNDTGK